MQNKTIVLNSNYSTLKNFAIFILFFFFTSVGFSQVKTITGQVLLSENLRSVDDIYIHNLNTNKFAVTNITGGFEINVSLGDTLKFYGEFLKDRELIITQKNLEAKLMYVALENEVIALDELIANPFITGNLKADLKKIKYIDTISVLYAHLGLDIKNRDLKPTEKRGSVIPTIGNIPIPISLNVEALYKLMNGYYKKQERLHEYEALDKTTKALLEMIPNDYYLSTLKIPEEETFNFALFAANTDKSRFKKLIDDFNTAEIKILLQKKAKIYLNRLSKYEKDLQNYSPN